MEAENKKSNKGNVVLTVIAILTLLVAIVGATFAYFTATITGNSTDDNVKVTTDTYGINITGLDDGAIELVNQNLPQNEAGQDYTISKSFSVASTSNQERSIKINLEDVANTFCQTVNAQTDADCAESGSVNVSDEIYYTLEKCTSNGTGCTVVEGKEKVATPTSDIIVYTDSIAAKGTNYYRITFGVKNKDVEQNYNQGKSFSTKVSISENVES